MNIPRCPNCSYVLVLLERRLKYKCAKCSRLFPKQEVENLAFRLWNKKQKEIDRHNLKLQRKLMGRPKILSSEERKLRARESALSYRQRNRAKEAERERVWRENNRERYNARKREDWAKNKDSLNARKKELRDRDPDRFSSYLRLTRLRRKQAKLALQELEINKKTSLTNINSLYYKEIKR